MGNYRETVLSALKRRRIRSEHVITVRYPVFAVAFVSKAVSMNRRVPKAPPRSHEK